MRKHRKGILIFLCILTIIIGYFAIEILYPDVMILGIGKTKIVTIGDSLTYGQGVISERETQSYQAYLTQLMPETKIYNYGLSNRSLTSTSTMPYSEEKLYKKSLNQKADIVIIMLGTNDSKQINWDPELYKKEYIEFVQEYQNKKGNPKVYVMLPPKVFLTVQNERDCNDYVIREEMIPIIKEVAKITSVPVIDLYHVTEDHPEWYVDELHLNADGNKAIAKEIYRILTK